MLNFVLGVFLLLQLTNGDTPTFEDHIEGRRSLCSEEVCKALKPTPRECLCYCKDNFPYDNFFDKDGQSAQNCPTGTTVDWRPPDICLKDPWKDTSVIVTVVSLSGLIVALLLVLCFCPERFKACGDRVKASVRRPTAWLAGRAASARRRMAWLPGRKTKRDQDTPFISMPSVLAQAPAPHHGTNQANGASQHNGAVGRKNSEGIKNHHDPIPKKTFSTRVHAQAEDSGCFKALTGHSHHILETPV